MTEPEVANGKDLADETTKNGKKSKEETSKGKRSIRKKPVENESDEEEPEVIPEARTKRGAQKTEKNSSKDTAEAGNKKGKVPLLDKPTIVEGSRNRRTVVQYESKVTVKKFSPIDIPKGKGTPLGRIPNINARMKRLRQNVLKELHRFLFGKCGNPDNFTVNLQKFCGFTFEKESDPYNRKLSLLNKFPIEDVKELLYFLDLDLKYKKKDEAVRRVLNFLIRPDISNTEQTVQPAGHPKRKATKRNYEDAEIDEAELKKKKKQPTAAKSSAEDAESGKPEENGKVESRRKTKNSSESETNATDDDAQKENESDADDDNNEMKKPAKKRKRNQVIDEPKETKNQKKKSISKQKKKKAQQEEADDSQSEASAEEEEKKKKTDLTDEELKSFLQSVLANANLEETTMKTVYGLINTHYPEYNFSKKKEFIKEIVKSLLQSS